MYQIGEGRGAQRLTRKSSAPARKPVTASSILISSARA